MEFRERKISPYFDGTTTPQEQMELLLRRKRAQDEQRIAQMNAERRQFNAVLTDLAVDIHRKRHFDYAQSFQTLSVILEHAGVQVVTYIGQEVTDEMKEDLEIVDWLPANGDPLDRVVDAFEPEVRINGKITHRAKLICREGGDAAEKPAPSGAEGTPAEKIEDAEGKIEEIPEKGTNPSKQPLHPGYHGCVSKKRQKNRKKKQHRR